MPFTGSHPAAVLPLFRMGLLASALVVGSITPDLPYFLPLPVTSDQTHSLVGVIGADVLLGICAFLAWHLLLVQPLMWAAPEGVQRRVPERHLGGISTRLTNAKDFGLLYLALAMGALTHVVWDSLTHAGMWGPRTFPALNSIVYGLQVTRWLHLAFSVAGLVCLVWFLRRWWQETAPEGAAEPVRPAIRWGLAIALLGWASWSTAQLMVGRVLPTGPASVEVLLVDSVVKFMATLLIGVLGLAVGWHVVRAARSARDQVESEQS